MSACTNRLTIRIKVAEPQILQRLQGELLKPEAQKYVVNRLEKALKEQSARPQARQRLARQLEQEKRKLQNLVAAIEGGSSTPAVLLKAVQEREDAIRKLEGELRQTGQAQPEMPTGAALQRLVQEQLGDLVGLLKTDTAKVKSEFRRLNLQLTFHPVEAKPRPHFVVKGQCDLAALVFSFVRPAERSPKAIRGLPGAVLDLTRE